MNNESTFASQGGHKNSELYALAKALLSQQDACSLPDKEHKTTVDIGFIDELVEVPLKIARESRLWGVLYRGIGFIPYPDKAIGDDSKRREPTHYLAFTVGEFFPPESPYEVEGIARLARFNGYSNFFATIITKTQFEVFTGQREQILPRDGCAVWDPRCQEYTAENPFASIMRQAAEYREQNFPYRMLFNVDTLRGSVVICDHKGGLYHLPENQEERRKMSLDSGISPLTVKKLNRGKRASGKRVIELMKEDLLGEGRFLNPVPLNELERGEIDLGGEGPRTTYSLLNYDLGVAPGRKSTPRKRLGF
ncbi:hypothetical protein CMO93_05785 [Candidatus Woesearchaeota archaeon]|jgi:hypothetical protein|nr:hypothetical protein [Candidatus Woesearchaeota archaeon]|tara:strand:+ start:3125 stop:4048 length:924 start_codon:yes stop_codon:yes gene_type:complete